MNFFKINTKNYLNRIFIVSDMENLFFLREYLKDKNIASVIPSSPSTVKKVCSKIDFSKKNVIVEYGPGTGVFTRHLLERMNPESKLILIETNRNFVSLLRNIDDPRVFVFNDSAANIKKILKLCNEDNADYIISGIPFSYLNDSLKSDIIGKSKDVLSEDGKFLVYQFVNGIKKNLEQYFEFVQTDFSLFNIPPLHIFEAFKD